MSQLRVEEYNQFMNDPAHEFAYGTTKRLMGWSLKRKKETWLLVVKAHSKGQGNEVAFIETSTAVGCYEYLALYCYRAGTPLRWLPDRYG